MKHKMSDDKSHSWIDDLYQWKSYKVISIKIDHIYETTIYRRENHVKKFFSSPSYYPWPAEWNRPAAGWRVDCGTSFCLALRKHSQLLTRQVWSTFSRSEQQQSKGVPTAYRYCTERTSAGKSTFAVHSQSRNNSKIPNQFTQNHHIIKQTYIYTITQFYKALSIENFIYMAWQILCLAALGSSTSSKTFSKSTNIRASEAMDSVMNSING